MTNHSAFILKLTLRPSSRVTRFASSCWADWLRLSSTPHSRMRLPNMRKPMSSALLGATAPAMMVTKMGNRMRVVFDTALGAYSMRIIRSFLVVMARTMGGWMMGTRAM